MRILSPRIGISRMQVLACLFGAIAGLVPGVSFTGPFWGMNFMEGSSFATLGDRRVRVTDVQPGSPAERAGIRGGDLFVSPARMEDVQKARDAAQRGSVQEFRIERDEQEITIEVGATPAELAAIWYADPWFPIAGILFAGVGALVCLTSSRVPAPRWRSILVILAASLLALGLGVATASGSVFSRFRVYQKWPMGTGAEWDFHQGLLGTLAGLLLALSAVIEVRRAARSHCAGEMHDSDSASPAE